MALLAAVSLAVVMALRNPFIGYLSWGWTSVLPVTYLMYGFMSSARINLLFAALSLVLFFFKKGTIRLPKLSAGLLLLLLFTAHVSISATFALPGNLKNAQYYEVFIKSLAFALLIPALVIDRYRMHAFIVMVVMAMGLAASIEGAKVLVTLGAHRIHGLGVGMLGDNNHFASAVALLFPLCVYIAQTSRHRLVSLGFWGLVALFAFCILGSRSRGAFVGLCVGVVSLILISQHKLKFSLIVGVIAFVFMNYFSDVLLERLNTIDNYGEDSSFLQRVNAWRVSSAIALDHPFIGGGLKAMESQLIWTQYLYSPGLLGWIELPEPETIARSAHSIYFEVLGSHGFIGLFLFIGLWINGVLTCLRVRQLSGRSPNLRWAADLAYTFLTCLAVYATVGLVTSLVYYEIYYMLLMLIEALRGWVLKQSLTEASTQAAQTVRAGMVGNA